MKIIILIFGLTLSSLLSFSQKKTDFIDYYTFNTNLLDKILLEKCNQKRINVSSKPFITTKLTELCAKYKSEYLKINDVISHENKLPYKGVILSKPIDRVEYFNKKLKTDVHYTGEIIHYRGLYKDSLITYDELAELVITSFMDSKPHKITMLHYLKNSEYTPCASFSSSLRIGDDYMHIYVTGVTGIKYD